MLTRYFTKKNIDSVQLIIISLFAFLSSIAIVGGNDFPTAGFALFFAGLATLVFYRQADKQRSDRLAYGFMLLLCVSLIFRSSSWEVLLSFIAIIYLGSLMINRPWGRENLSELIFVPFISLLRTWTQPQDTKLFATMGGNFGNPNFLIGMRNFVSALIAILIVLIIVPILASANPIFSNHLSQLKQILPALDFRIDVFVARFVMTGILIFFIPKIMSVATSRKNQKNQTKRAWRPTLISLTPTKLVVAIILGIFMITQAQLYTASDQLYEDLGITHSERTREVFGQLSVVSVIVMGLLFFGQKQKNKRLDTILGVENVLLLLFALHSDLTYIGEFGFTQARLYGLFFVGVLVLIFANFAVSSVKNWPQSMFLNYSIWILSASLVLLNIINVDYLVFHYRPAKNLSDQNDYNYLINLSSDALAYYDLYYHYARLGVNDPMEGYLGRKIFMLQEKYQNPDWRSFSFYEWLNYLEVKDLDPKVLFTYVEPKSF